MASWKTVWNFQQKSKWIVIRWKLICLEVSWGKTCIITNRLRSHPEFHCLLLKISYLFSKKVLILYNQIHFLTVFINNSFFAGSSVGAGLTYPICGFIIDKWGWEPVFYLSGILGTVWFIAWWIFVYDSPKQHPRITEEEKNYILKSLGQSVAQKKVYDL